MTGIGHESSCNAADKVADKVADTLQIEEGYSALGKSVERGMAVVHTVVHSHYTLVEFVKAAETERTERAADTPQIERKIQAGDNLKIAYNVGIVEKTVKGRGSGRPA